MSVRIMTFLSVLLSPLMLLAQPLADRVPANSMLYVGWCGSENLPAGYEKSHLKGLLDSSNVPQLMDTLMPQLIARVAKENADAAEALKKLAAIGGPLWRHPVAVFTAGIDLTAGMPRPRLGIICQAGKDADALAEQFASLAAQAATAPFPVKSFKQQELVGLLVGYDQEAQAIPGGGEAGPKALAADDGFKQAMAQVQKDAVCVGYANFEAFFAMVDRFVQMSPDPTPAMMWPKIRDAAGIGGLKRAAWTGGFDGADWATTAFIAAPAPRTGLLTMLDAKPMSDDALKLVPKSATWVTGTRFDVGKLFREIRTAAGAVDPNFQKMFDQGLGVAQAATMVNLQTDLFEALGDEWLCYADAQIAGSGPLSAVLVNRLAKTAEAQRAIGKLDLFLDNTINGQLQRQRMQVSFQQVKVGELTIHTVNLPVVAPSWAIKDGVLYVALYPQVLAAATDSSIAKGGSILDNEQFRSLRKRLSDDKAAGISYADLPKMADGIYPLLLLGSQTALGFGDMFGIKVPPMVMPTLSKFKENLSPVAEFSWTDDAGWHLKGTGPFPCAEVLVSPAGLLSALPLLASMKAATPRVAMANAPAGRVKSASNLRQIGQGVFLYANDHAGRYPADLATLHTDVDMPLDSYVNPAGGKGIPAEIRAGKPEERMAWINANSDYVYLGGAMKASDPADAVLAHEKLRDGAPGANVLFNDGHVEWMTIPAAKKVIEVQNKPK